MSRPKRPVPRTNGTIVWDLDQTLVHSSANLNEFSNLKLYSDPANFDIRDRCVKFNFTYDGETHTYWTIFRPNAYKALKFSFEHFANVVVWSAGVDPYVEQIVKFLFRDLPEPDAWFGRSFCGDPVTLPDGTIDYFAGKPTILPNGDSLYTKPLSKLSSYLNLPVRTMTIVEDRAVVLNTNPNNGILIPAYSPSFNVNAIRTYDDSLDKLIKWYSRIEYVRSPDITVLPKRHIFVDAVAPA